MNIYIHGNGGLFSLVEFVMLLPDFQREAADVGVPTFCLSFFLGRIGASTSDPLLMGALHNQWYIIQLT